MSKNTEVAPATNSALPVHLQSNAAPIGNENIQSSDLEIPRLKLLQSLSPEVQKGLDGYVQDAEAGMTINTTTGDLVEAFNCINIFFDREFAVFRKRTLGGDGIPLSITPTEAEAHAFLAESKFKADEYDVVDTARHLVMVVDDDGNRLFEAMMLMSATRLQFSKNWNSQIAATGIDRFGSVWKVIPHRITNSKGSWFSYKVDFVGWADEAIHGSCKDIYETISPAGVKVAA